MLTLISVAAIILGMSGDIKYPAICKDRYLSDEKFIDVVRAEKALSRKPGCVKIGEETITKGDRAGEIFPIYTCCTSVEAEKKL
jgi:hypothetical protein